MGNMSGHGRGYNMPTLPASYYPNPQQIGYATQPQRNRSFMMPRPAFYVPVSSDPPQQSVLGVIKQNEQVIEEEEMECLKPASSGESSENEEEVKEMENETNRGGFDECANTNDEEWMPKVKISQAMDVNEDVKSELSDCTESTAWNTHR